MLGVEYSHGVRYLRIGAVVVADNKVDVFIGGVLHLINSFDATVEGNNKATALAGSVVYPLKRNTIAFGIAVGYVGVKQRSVVAEVAVQQRYG